MGHSELFLLLPRYEEATGQPNYIKSEKLMTAEDILKVMESINEICCFIANENYEGYYDANNVSAFLYPVRVMEGCYPNIMTRMRMTMNKWGENWRTQKRQKDTESYAYYNSPIKDDTLCEMIKRKIAADENVFLLVNQDAFSCSTRTIQVKRNGDEVKDEAKNMLVKAIGTDSRVLYFFDKVHKKYIEFKRESDNIYHGFHLDDEDEKRVPEDIKMMIDKLI